MSINEGNVRLTDILNALEKRIYNNINCVKIGKIKKFNSEDFTVDVDLIYKRKVSGGAEDRYVSYPTLPQCPIFMQAGDEHPIAVGDHCLVLFNDDEVDLWFGNSTSNNIPNTNVTHDINNGIALIGIRTRTQAPNDYLPTQRKIGYEDTNITLDSQVSIKNSASNFYTILTNMITILTAIDSFAGSGQSANISNLQAEINNLFKP